MKTIDLIVPCYNEAQALPMLYREVFRVAEELKNFEFRFILINDGSTDKTFSVMTALAEHDKRVRYISFSRNFGKEAAMLAGMRYSSAEYVGIIDADLQHSPNLLKSMLDCLEREPDVDVAAARRSDRNGEEKFKSAFSALFYKIINKMSTVEIPESAQDFRVMRRKVVDAILSMPEYHRFSKGIFSWVGFNTRWFEHENRERAAGETKWSFRSLIKYAFDGIIGFSTVPLKIVLMLGIVISLIGVVYGFIVCLAIYREIS
ncbi:MAG: glycosyltransferase family 2 protein, partial [Clostridia bacterium]|nr:glycosyltransferase family 2 protein [Clostridia bacterium]